MTSKESSTKKEPELRDPGDIINDMTAKSVEEGRKIGMGYDKYINYRKPGTGERGHENPDKTWAMFVKPIDSHNSLG